MNREVMFADVGPPRTRWKSYLLITAVVLPLVLFSACAACFVYVEYQCQAYADC